MARYGIDRALLAAQQPDTDHPADRKVDIDNPWARVQAHLFCGLASALRCQCVILPRSGPGTRIHIFGFASDVERADVLYTSLLVQMWQGLAATDVPPWTHSVRAWRRSWLLGFTSAVVARVRAAEQKAAAQADDQRENAGPSTDLVLADRARIVQRSIEHAYPVTRKTQMTYRGSGYGAGYVQGRPGRPRWGRLAAKPRAGPAWAVARGG